MADSFSLLSRLAGPTWSPFGTMLPTFGPRPQAPWLQGGDPTALAAEMAAAGVAGLSGPTTGFPHGPRSELGLAKALADQGLGGEYIRALGERALPGIQAPEIDLPMPQVPAPVQGPPNPYEGSSVIPGPVLDYMKGLPQYALPKVTVPRPAPSTLQPTALPADPDYGKTREALVAGAPGAYEDQPGALTKDHMIWQMLASILAAGAESNMDELGPALMRMAAGGLGGVAQFKEKERTEKQAHSKEEKRYQQWLAGQEAGLEQTSFSNKMGKAQTEFDMKSAQTSDERNVFSQLMQSLGLQVQQNAASAEAGFKNQAARYEAGLKNLEQFSPKISGDNLIQTKEDGSRVVTNLDPMKGLALKLMTGSGGGQPVLPPSSFSLRTLAAGLPPEAQALVQSEMEAIVKSPTYQGITQLGEGGKDHADTLVVSMIINNLVQKAKTDPQAASALQALYSAMQKGAIIDKLPVK